MKALKIILLAAIVVLWGITVSALEPIPDKSGFSGYLSLGGGVIDLKSNMTAGNRFVDFGNDTINSLGGPDSETKFVPTINFELKYTFAETRTQMFLGNSLEDLLTFDLATQAGVRQDMKNLGIMAGSFVFSGVPTEVWADPYLTNAARQDTDRTSTGFRFTWDSIFQTGFQWQSTYRKVEIDEERSGVSLGLTAAERALLNREGNTFKNEISYKYRIDKGKIFIPSVMYIQNDRDGGAMDSDAFNIQLSYIHTVGRYNLIFNGIWGVADYDQVNPIFNQTREDDVLGLGGAVYYLLPDYTPMGCSSLRLWGSAAYYQSDSNISFYDTEVSSISFGVILNY